MTTDNSQPQPNHKIYSQLSSKAINQLMQTNEWGRFAWKCKYICVCVWHCDYIVFTHACTVNCKVMTLLNLACTIHWACLVKHVSQMSSELTDGGIN